MGHGDRSHQLSLSLYENGREGPGVWKKLLDSGDSWVKDGWHPKQMSFQGGVLMLGLGSPLVQGSGPGSLMEEPK